MSNPVATIETCYGAVSQQVMAQAQQIKLLICDVDGVMSDRVIYQEITVKSLKPSTCAMVMAFAAC